MKFKKQFIYNSYFRARFRTKKKMKGPIFIIGTGRSGTHFLCSCLNEFPELSDGFDGKESPYIFHEIAKLTVRGKDLPSYVFNYYEHMQKKIAPNLLVDQTHPNIWHAERLIEEFPASKFLAISRNVYSVVYSMKMHNGVSRWIKDHKKYPRPNAFLGITSENGSTYDNLSDLQKAVFRWCSHERRIKYLVNTFPQSVMKIRYEDLYENMKGSMSRISTFLGVKDAESFKSFNEGSLHKKNNFQISEISQIEEALSMYNEFSGE